MVAPGAIFTTNSWVSEMDDDKMLTRETFEQWSNFIGQLQEEVSFLVSILTEKQIGQFKEWVEKREAERDA